VRERERERERKREREKRRERERENEREREKMRERENERESEREKAREQESEQGGVRERLVASNERGGDRESERTRERERESMCERKNERERERERERRRKRDWERDLWRRSEFARPTEEKISKRQSGTPNRHNFLRPKERGFRDTVPCGREKERESKRERESRIAYTSHKLSPLQLSASKRAGSLLVIQCPAGARARARAREGGKERESHKWHEWVTN